MELFGIRLRRSKKGSEDELDSTSSDEGDSESDLEEEDRRRAKQRQSTSSGLFGWTDDRRKRKARASKRRGKSVPMWDMLYKAIKLLPKTSQGWGMLLLFILLTMYVIDFQFLFLNDTSSKSPSTTHVSSGSELQQKPAAKAPYYQYQEATPPQAVKAVSEAAKATTPHENIQQPPLAPIDARAGAPPPLPPAATAPVVQAPSINKPSTATTFQQTHAAELGTTSHSSSQDSFADVSAFSHADVGLWVPANTGPLTSSDVKEYYTKLAKKYLEPFKNGISRDRFFEILRRRMYSLTPNGANKGIQSMLLQMKAGRIYLLDPYDVTKKSQSFYKNRINELIYLLKKLTSAGRIPDTEFLISIHDCVQTVSKEHTYRAARYVESNPGFTIVGCNFSDNIPIPMWEGDESRGGGYETWDQRMKDFAKDPYPWTAKDPRAVFRGGLRTSAMFSNKTDGEKRCETAGRSALVYHAEKRPDILDVSVGGSCGGRKYLLSRLAPEEHHKYKYVLYAEGNCFWADRINRQLFGPSVVIKQETPCGQFFEPLLQPGVHYVPTDFFFTDLESKIEDLKANDEKAADIVRQANQFAANFLSFEGIMTYTEALLTEYTKLLEMKEIKIDDGAKDVTDMRF